MYSSRAGRPRDDSVTIGGRAAATAAARDTRQRGPTRPNTQLGGARRSTAARPAGARESGASNSLSAKRDVARAPGPHPARGADSDGVDGQWIGRRLCWQVPTPSVTAVTEHAEVRSQW